MQVSEQLIFDDLAMKKFQWDHPMSSPRRDSRPRNVTVCTDALAACRQAHAIVVLTEWDEFKEIDFEAVYQVLPHPHAARHSLLCNAADLKLLCTLHSSMAAEMH